MIANIFYPIFTLTIAVLACFIWKKKKKKNYFGILQPCLQNQCTHIFLYYLLPYIAQWLQVTEFQKTFLVWVILGIFVILIILLVEVKCELRRAYVADWLLNTRHTVNAGKIYEKFQTYHLQLPFVHNCTKFGWLQELVL